MPTQADIDRLTQQISDLKKQRADVLQQLPPEPIHDYSFQSQDGPVILSQLLGNKPDLILIHNMGRSCKYCTTWADGFIGLTPHLSDRAAFIVSSPDDVETQAAFAKSRGWPFRMVSVKGTTFAKDMGYERKEGDFWPGVSAFHKDGATITRTGTAQFGPGDDFCALWHLFDLLKGGQGAWEPKYRY